MPGSCLIESLTGVKGRTRACDRGDWATTIGSPQKLETRNCPLIESRKPAR